MDLRAKKGDAINADAWNALVAKANKADLSFRASKKERKIHLAEFAENSSWERRDGFYRRQARFVDINKGGKVLREAPSGEFEISAYSVSSGPKTPRFYVVWRGQWEILHWRGGYARLIGGEGMLFETLDEDNNEHRLTNTGILSCNGSSNAITLNPDQFMRFRATDYISNTALDIGVEYAYQVITNVAPAPDDAGGRAVYETALRPIICNNCGAQNGSTRRTDGIKTLKVYATDSTYYGFQE